MQALANYVMRGRIAATLVVTLFGLLSLLFPPIGYLSGGAVALVTLRHGTKEGAMVLIGALLAAGLFASLVFGSPMIALVMGLVSWVPVWGVAQVLRGTISLTKTMQMTLLLGVLAVTAMHLVVGDTALWWREVLEVIFQPVMEAGVTVEGASWEESISQMASLMTGVVAAALMLSTLISLLIGRWWQSLLYNPGGFREEFHGLRADKGLAIALFVCVGLALMGVGSWVSDLIPVLLLPFLLAGLAMIHTTVASLKANALWLIAAYGMLVIALPQMGTLVALLGVIDSWVDLRALLKKKIGASS